MKKKSVKRTGVKKQKLKKLSDKKSPKKTDVNENGNIIKEAKNFPNWKNFINNSSELL